MQLAKYLSTSQTYSIALIALLCACSNTKRSDPNTITTIISGPPGAMDPLFSTDANSQHINELIHAGLTRTGADLRPEPDLAKSFKIINPNTIEFTLKDNCKFHNGQLITSLDVKKSWELFTNDSVKSAFKDSLKQISAIEIIDASRFRIKTLQPNPALLGELAVMKIIPTQTYGKAFADQPIGAGPFRAIKISARETVLEVAADSCLTPQPSYQRLVIKTIRDDLSRFLKLRTGEVDIVTQDLGFRKVERVLKGLEPKLTAITTEGISYNYLGVNAADPLLKNPLVRQAIALSLDIPSLAHHHGRGLQSHAKTILADMSFYANHQLPLDSRDLPRAKNILDQIGFFNGQNNKPPLRLQLLTSNNPLATDNARILISQAKEAGIELELKSFEFGTFLADVKAKRTQLYLLRWVGATDPGIYADAFATDGINNRTNYHNPALDALVSGGEKEMNIHKRRDIYNSVQEIVHNDRPYINLWHNKNTAVFRKEISNVRLQASGSWRMFLDMKKAAQL